MRGLRYRAYKIGNIAAAGLGLALSCHPSHATDLSYAITDLGANFKPTAISDNGVIVGQDESTGASVAVRRNTTSGTLEPLGSNSQVTDINKFGISAGYELTAPNHHAVNWDGLSLTSRLEQFSNRSLIEARGINNSDEVTGIRLVDNQYQRIFTYDYFSGSLTTLETLGGAHAWANAINNRGYVAGSSENGLGHRYAVRYDGETLEDLTSLAGYNNSEGTAINDLNELAGFAYNTDSDRSGRRAILAREFEGLINLGTLNNDLDTKARAVNNDTLVVGQSTHSSGRQRAFIFDTSTVDQLVVQTDPGSGNIIYTGSTTGGGVNRSTLKGLNPVTINHGLVDRNVNCILVDPENSSNLYLGTNSGAYRSVDQGDSWELMSVQLEGLAVYALHIDPVDSNILYAGTNQGIYYSEDLGDSWTLSPDTNGFSAHNFVTGIDDRSIYAATSKGLYITDDQGQKWTENNGQEDQRLFIRNLSDIALDRNPTPAVLYAASQGGGIYRTNDLTKDKILWDRVNEGIGSRIIYDLLVDDSVNPSVIYAGSQMEMLKLIPSSPIDERDTWEQIPQFDAVGVYSMALSNDSGKNLYVTTRDGGAFRSDDSEGAIGEIWTSIISGVTTADIYDLMAIPDPNPRESKILAASSNGIFNAAINGVFEEDVVEPSLNLHWSQPRSGGSGVKLTSLAQDDSVTPPMLWAGSSDRGIYMSENGGSTWFRITRGLDNYNVQDVVADTSLHPQIVYAATLDGVYRSDDGGFIWQQASGGLASLSVLSLALDGDSNPQVLYAGTIDGVFRSTDQGRNWTPINQGLEGIDINQLYINPANNAELIASSGSAGLFRSLDRGNSWQSLNEGLADVRINDITAHPTTAGTLAIATNSGVYQISDVFCSGATPCWTWKALNAGISSLNCFAILINPDDPTEYIVGVGKEGAYKSIDSGATWTHIEEGLASERLSIVDLNELVAYGQSDPIWQLEDATASNNNGEIVGTGQLNGEEHGYLLTPVQGTLSASLRVSVKPQPETVKPDIPMSYEITVTNDGPDSATGIQLTDWLPHDVIYRHTSSSRGVCNKDDLRNLVRCNLGAISPGDSTYVSISLEPTKPELKIHNIVRVTASEYDPDMSDNTSGLDTWVQVDRCFIATAAYGSLLHPYVVELRAFRDHYLMTNELGRYLVQQYYRHSPPLADYIRQHEWARLLTQVVLAPIVFTVSYPLAAAALLLLLITVYWRRRQRLRLA